MNHLFLISRDLTPSEERKKTKENQIESLHTYKNQSQDQQQHQYLFVLNVQLKKKSEWIIKGCK